MIEFIKDEGKLYFKETLKEIDLHGQKLGGKGFVLQIKGIGAYYAKDKATVNYIINEAMDIFEGEDLDIRIHNIDTGKSNFSKKEAKEKLQTYLKKQIKTFNL